MANPNMGYPERHPSLPDRSLPFRNVSAPDPGHLGRETPPVTQGPVIRTRAGRVYEYTGRPVSGGRQHP